MPPGAAAVALCRCWLAGRLGVKIPPVVRRHAMLPLCMLLCVVVVVVVPGAPSTERLPGHLLLTSLRSVLPLASGSKVRSNPIERRIPGGVSAAPQK